MILFDRSTLLVKYASDETESLNKPPISNKREQHTRVNHTRIQFSTFYIQTSRRVNYDVTRTSVLRSCSESKATRLLHEITRNFPSSQNPSYPKHPRNPSKDRSSSDSKNYYQN